MTVRLLARAVLPRLHDLVSLRILRAQRQVVLFIQRHRACRAPPEARPGDEALGDTLQAPLLSSAVSPIFREHATIHATIPATLSSAVGGQFLRFLHHTCK